MEKLIDSQRLLIEKLEANITVLIETLSLQEKIISTMEGRIFDLTEQSKFDQEIKKSSKLLNEAKELLS